MTAAQSLRGQFLMVAAVLGVLVLGAALVGQTRVTESARLGKALSSDYAQLENALDTLEETLRDTDSALYQYAFLLDPRLRDTAATRIQEALRQSRDMAALQVTARYPSIHGAAASLRDILAALSRETRDLVQVLASAERRFPGMRLVVDEIFPAHERFMQAVILAIEEGEESHGAAEMAALRLFQESRYTWMQHTDAFRLFVANRFGAFGDDPLPAMQRMRERRDDFLRGTRVQLQRLDALDRDGVLGLQQSESLELMWESVRNHENSFPQVDAVYLSDQWRSDLPLMRDRIAPLLFGAWDALGILKKEADGLLRSSAQRALDVAEGNAWIIWSFTLSVFLLLLAAFLVFERTLRRPISQLAGALHAEGRGESDATLPEPRAEETRLLVQAFREMQQQVRSRQQRLSAVLDNAGEGIVTFGEDGTVESLNQAAQAHFGYPAAEDHGLSVGEIIPAWEDERWRRSSEAGCKVTTEGQRRDRTRFPMSLNLSRIELEGRRLYTAIVDDIAERQAMLERLQTMAERDALTGLYNRAYFYDALDREVGRARRGDGLGRSLLHMDLDNFKLINDTHGHLAGDRVLTDVADLLQARLRSSDLASRLGGDEFAVLLHGVTAEEAGDIAEMYRRSIAERGFKHEGYTLDVGCSIGVASFEPRMGRRDRWLACADAAGRLAKRAGRNRVHAWQDGDRRLEAELEDPVGWGERVRAALEQDGLALAFQPIVDCATGETWAHEVLVRLRDPGGALIEANAFLPPAERLGLMPDIDRWVLARAVELLASGGEAPVPARLSVNVARSSAADQGVLDELAQRLLNTGVAPEQLIVELSEPALTADVDSGSQFLHRVRELGCAVALDDFGVGHASLLYLSDLPADYLKLDMAQLLGIHSDSFLQALVRSTVDLAHVAGMKAVAKNLEDCGLLATLAAVGFDYSQGRCHAAADAVP